MNYDEFALYITLPKCCTDLSMLQALFMCGSCKLKEVFRPASVAQLDVPSYWRPEGRRFNPRRGRQHSFVETDHEIFPTVILSL